MRLHCLIFHWFLSFPVKKKITNIFLDPGSQVAKLSNLDLSDASVFEHVCKYIRDHTISRPHLKLDRTRLDFEQLEHLLSTIQADVQSIRCEGGQGAVLCCYVLALPRDLALTDGRTCDIGCTAAWQATRSPTLGRNSWRISFSTGRS